MKPFFNNLEFEPKPTDKGNLGAVWAGVLNTVKGVFEDDKHVIATQAPISGRIDAPAIDSWTAFIGVLANAWIQSLKPGFDPNAEPPKPTDYGDHAEVGSNGGGSAAAIAGGQADRLTR